MSNSSFPLLFRVCSWLIGLIFLTATLSAIDPGYTIDNPPQGVFVEDWMEIFVDGSKVGYSRFTLTRQGDEVRSESLSRLRFDRGAVTLKMDNDLSTVETIDGQARSFKMTVAMAGLPIYTEGEITGDQLKVNIRQMDIEQSHQYAWVADALLPWGFTRNYLNHGLSEGLSYSMSLFSPDIRLDGPVTADIEVGEKESFSHKGQQFSGIHVITTVKFSTGKVVTHTWVDETTGATLRSTMGMGGIQIEMYAVDEQTALETFVPADLFEYSLLQVDRSIPKNARTVTYQVDLEVPLQESMDWPSTRYQKILESSKDSIKIRVERADHRKLQLMPLQKDKPKAYHAEALADNLTINTKDKKLRKLAKKAAGRVREPVALADRLRRFATDYISDKTLAVGFATASEVARNPSGDCSEHAVFLAALGRIRGIPSRVVYGLAYLEEFQGKPNILGFHMWTQFNIHGLWVDFDAMLEESECSPTRIAIFTSTLEHDTVADVAVPLMDILGRMKISIVDVQ